MSAIRKPARIVVADDDATIRRLLGEILIREGYGVKSCPDGETALREARAVDTRLLITDYQMPGKTGLDVIRELRAAKNLLPVIIISGSHEEQATAAVKGFTRVLFLPKPFLLGRCKAMVEMVLQQAPSASTLTPPEVRAERRRHVRFEVQDASAELLPKGGVGRFLGVGARNCGHSLLNLSEGGASFVATERLRRDQAVRVKVRIDRFQESIEGEGVVQWCHESSRAKGEFRTGVMFVDPAPSLSGRIRALQGYLESPACRSRQAGRSRVSSRTILPE